MSNTALAWVLVVGLFAALIVMRGWGGLGHDRATALRADVERLEAETAVLEAQRDSVATLALRRDTVLVAITDTVIRTVERARERGTEAGDSLRNYVTPEGHVWLDSLLVAHAEEVAAIERLSEQRLLWGQSWKDAYDAANEVVMSQQATLVQHRLLESVLYAEIRSRRRQNVALKMGAVVLGAAIVYGAVR